MLSFPYWFCHAIRIPLELAYPASEYVLNVLWRVFLGGTKPLPPIQNKILLMPATELAEKIRKRELSCVEVMQTYVQRSVEVQSVVNAVADERYEQALIDAADADKFLASSGKSEEQLARDTPLFGIPFTCKEPLGIKGMSQNAGWIPAKHRKAEEDCAAASLFRKAGAIPFAVTNVSQLCTFWEAANPVYGRTKNPYDHTRTPGGSSGGEAANLTSAGSVIGIARDGMGSIRIPAAFCGIYGHKSTGGLVSNRGAYPPLQGKKKAGKGPVSDAEEVEVIKNHINTGPMCRYAKDLSLLLRVMSNNDGRLRLDEKVDFRKVKVYYMTDVPGIFSRCLPRPDIKKAVLKAVGHFEAKYEIKPVKLQLDGLKYAFESMIVKKVMPEPLPLKTSLYMWTELLKCLFRQSVWTFPNIYQTLVLNSVRNALYYKCLNEFNALETKFREIFEEDSVFFFPTTPEPAPHYLMNVVKSAHCGYSGFFNNIQCCSTTIPVDRSNGLPIGVQAISGPFNDHLTIAVAVELEKVFHGWISPSAIDV